MKESPDLSQAERAELLELYKIAIDEYRFQIRLNWDRMRYYLVLNAGILAAGTGLLQIEETKNVRVLLLLIFLSGIGTSWVAYWAIRKGRQYYRRAVFKKTIIEHMLGLLEPVLGSQYEDVNTAVATTPSMADVRPILEDPASWIRRAVIQPGSVVFYVVCLLGLFAIVDAVGIVILVHEMWSGAADR